MLEFPNLWSYWDSFEITIEGTPAETGTFRFTLETKNAAGTDTAEFSITIREPVDITAAFTDPRFLAAVRNHLRKTPDEPVFDVEVAGIKYLNVDSRSIRSLAGIEHFTLLTGLGASFNQITELDMSANPNLRSIYMPGNPLTRLDVSKNPALEVLELDWNRLDSLDVSHNPRLRYLYVTGNRLTALDVSNNPLLQNLHIGYNRITTLDVTNTPALEWLSVQGNQLTDIDLSGNHELVTLSLCDNRLTALDLPYTPFLRNLDVSSNRLTALDVSNSASLRRLTVTENHMHSPSDVIGWRLHFDYAGGWSDPFRFFPQREPLLCADCDAFPCECEFIVPPTGLADIAWYMYVLTAFAALSAALWSGFFMPRRKRF
jgi:Leucine-rich repeat (LRR) protein